MMTREDEARELARRHYAVEAGVREIYIIKGNGDNGAAHGGGGSERRDAIKLLEVNENTIAAGISPIQFGPAPASGIHFPSLIVEITPDEFERLRAGDLALPEGWEIGDHIERPKAVRAE